MPLIAFVIGFVLGAIFAFAALVILGVAGHGVRDRASNLERHMGKQASR